MEAGAVAALREPAEPQQAPRPTGVDAESGRAEGGGDDIGRKASGEAQGGGTSAGVTTQVAPIGGKDRPGGEGTAGGGVGDATEGEQAGEGGRGRGGGTGGPRAVGGGKEAVEQVGPEVGEGPEGAGAGEEAEDGGRRELGKNDPAVQCSAVQRMFV